MEMCPHPTNTTPLGNYNLKTLNPEIVSNSETQQHVGSKMFLKINFLSKLTADQTSL